MDLNNVTVALEVVIKLMTAAAIILLTYMLPKIKAWVTQKVDAQRAEELEALINTFVSAAEQMLKSKDKTGEQRKAYVQEQLTELGINVDGFVNALIEKVVYDLNFFNK